DDPPPAAPEAPVRRWGGGDDVISGAEGTVRAAGGVVWSRWHGGLRVVVVHRPRYDDWSLPKGKAGPGESDAECALREVREETGLACSLGEELGTNTYSDRHGRLKTVRYYAMQPLGGGEGPQAEVDEVRWLGLEEAKRLLSYERDVAMLDALAAMAARRGEPEEPTMG
ncbi:MAG TPA: NUDIX hydrolase, partial [Acidimicrobiia bacterium]